MLNEKEIKRIQRYCLFPTLAIAFILTELLIALVWLLLVMVNDLVFYGSFAGIFLYAGITAVYLVAWGICFIVPRLGMRNKKWDEIVEKAAVSVQEGNYSAQVSAVIGTKAAGSLLHRSNNSNLNRAGNAADALAAVGAFATVTKMANESRKNAKLVAAALGVKVPKARNYVLAVVILPVVLLVASYIPHYISAKRTKDAQIAVASEAVYALRAALEEGCERVIMDDPSERYDKGGYDVTGYLYGNDLRDAHMYVTVDNDGRIAEIHYYIDIDIDIQADKETNLSVAASDLRALNGMIRASGLEAAASDLLDVCEMPDEFLTLFQETSYYERVEVKEGENITVSYVTYSEEQYERYGPAYIHFRIKPAD